MIQLPSSLNTVKELLQGKGILSHPIHVAINHVPLGCWEASVVFDLMSRQRKWRKLSEAGYYLNLFGIVSAIPTSLTGVAEWLDIPQDDPAWKVATAHAALNDVALLLSLYNWWTRRDRRNFAPDQSNLLVSGVLVAVLGLSGYLGGVLAHEYGLGTQQPDSSNDQQSADEGSLDSWAGVQSEQVQERDPAVDEALGTASPNRELGGTGI